MSVIAGKVAPPTKEDAKLSKKHLKESIKFNKKHSKEHDQAAEKAKKLLKNKKYIRT